MSYTIKNLREIDDVAPRFGFDSIQEARFAFRDLDADDTGLAYHVNRNFTVELAYRYLDMGTANHGFGTSFDGSNAGPSSFQFRDITSQDLRLGVRWTCCDVEPPPPPLIRKG